MRDYEQYKFGAVIEACHTDLGYSDDEVAAMSSDAYTAMCQELRKLVEDQLALVVVADMKEAGELTEDRRSFILQAGTNHTRARSKKNART
jgi:hypothetical protein